MKKQYETRADVESHTELTRRTTVVDRLNLARDERNREVWSARLASGRKAKIIWTIDNARWKQTLYATLEQNRPPR